MLRARGVWINIGSFCPAYPFIRLQLLKARAAATTAL